ncbi:MAG: DUF503 domain-containing protein [Candidatus Omnitrophica bacterium]|nr:DUF503 domain-containing protein [Candidatus Omnitrophota bacterium]
MTVGILTLSLFIPGSNSLKQKRSVLKALKSRLILKFNVCVAEIDLHEKWQRAVLAVGFINTDRGVIDALFSKILKFMEKSAGCDLVDFHQQLI